MTSPVGSPLTQGVIAGLALTLASVALGALVFGSYGYTMFVLTPVFVGATTGYIVNRKRDLGVGRTTVLVLWAIALGGLALIVAALEGVICIIMAAPLAIGVGIIGGLIGRALALYGRRSPGRAAASLAVLPLLFGAEHALPPSVTFDSAQSVTVNASADAVWRAVVDMQPIRAAPPLPLRLGVAYPISARLEGEGVGGRRIGVFSTGDAVEQITEWQPGRRLAFKILSDPPAMRELSPYRHVHAPHVQGYFLTHTTAFDITTLPDGRSRLTVSSTHELRLDPVFYWLPLARVVVRADDRRVLDHLRQQAEGG